MKYFKLLLFFVPVNIALAQGYFYGDIHVHSNLSFDTQVSVDSVYGYARNNSKIDFICVTDHDYQSNNQKWEIAKQKVNQYYEPGRFVTLLGYEYTRVPVGGHQIVIYPTSSHPRYSVDSTNEDLLNTKVIAQGGMINIAHPDLQRFPSNLWNYSSAHSLIEMSGYKFNRFEYFKNPGASNDQIPYHSIQDWLKTGAQLGFYGSSDDHEGKPGTYGLTGLILDTLTREAVFNALKQRHTFATNGKKIKLNVYSDDFVMGDLVEIYGGENLDFTIKVQGTTTISKIEIISNGYTIKTIFPASVNYTGVQSLHGITGGYFYVRVTQTDGGIAWSSPIFIDVKSSIAIKTFEQADGQSKFAVYPNPAHEEVNLIIDLKTASKVKIDLYDLLGRMIDIILDSELEKGEYSFPLKLNKIASGTYIIKIKRGNSVSYLKLIKV